MSTITLHVAGGSLQEGDDGAVYINPDMVKVFYRRKDKDVTTIIFEALGSLNVSETPEEIEQLLKGARSDG